MIPSVGSLVEVCTPETKGKRVREQVEATSTSGGRQAVTVAGIVGVFVGSYEGESWWTVEEVAPCLP